MSTLITPGITLVYPIAGTQDTPRDLPPSDLPRYPIYAIPSRATRVTGVWEPEDHDLAGPGVGGAV